MNTIPVINYTFSLEDALQSFGFEIDEKDSGACVAHGYIHKEYGEIFVEFNQSFITNYQTDMRVFYRNAHTRDDVTLFLGVAPVNKKDFATLMSYLLPSDEFKGELGILAN